MGGNEEVMGQYPARKGMPQDDVSRSPLASAWSTSILRV